MSRGLGDVYKRQFIMYGKNEENSELLSEAMDVLSDMDELQIRQCLAMMKAMKSVSVGK